MKKVLIALLCFVLLVSCASAESIDLSGLSFDQLLALRERIDAALWSSDEWQEVTVPIGTWKVGADIPAGKWTLSALQTESGRTLIMVGDELDQSSGSISSGHRRDYLFIFSPSYSSLEPEDPTEYIVELKNGDYLIVSMGPVVFHPFTGNPFGFK